MKRVSTSHAAHQTAGHGWWRLGAIAPTAKSGTGCAGEAEEGIKGSPFARCFGMPLGRGQKRKAGFPFFKGNRNEVENG